MTNYLEFKNLSTILTSIFLTIFGLIIGYASSQGLELPITAEALTTITMGIIFAVFGYYNAKNHNTFFDKENDTIYIPLDNLSEGQVTAINNFIENCINKNIEHKNTDYSEDPASAYTESDEI